MEPVDKDSEYGPVSYRQMVENVFNTVVTHVTGDFKFRSYQLFGLRPDRTNPDLLLILFRDWQDTLEDRDTLVTALDTANAFESVT